MPAEAASRTRSAAFALAVAAVAFAGPARAAEDPDLAGPPLLSANGCAHDREWNDKYVGSVLGVPERVVKKARTRWGMPAKDLCMLPRAVVDQFIEYAKQSKFGMDEPDKAMKWRKLSLMNPNGEVPVDGLSKALVERERILRRTLARPKGAGVTASSWTNLGPRNAGVSGRIRAIAPHPTIPGRILVGSVSGGIWRTTDSGQTWTPVNDFMPSVAIACLIHDPSNASVVYACTGEGAFNGDAVRGLGIFRSTDAGDTWTQIASTNPTAAAGQFLYVNRIGVHPTDSMTILAATWTGIYRTTDGGLSWTQASTAAAMDLKYSADGSLVLAGERQGGGVWRSVNGGPFTRVTVAQGGRVELAYSQSTGNWYAHVDFAPPPFTGSGGSVYKSVDGGQSWAFMSAPRVLGVQGWYDNAIWVAPDDDNKIIVGGASPGIAMSIDGGVNFTSIGDGVHPDHHVLVHDPQYLLNGIVYNGNDGGIYRFDGVQNVGPSNRPNQFNPPATSINNNLSITQFYGGTVGSVPTPRFYGGTQDNGTWVYDFSTDRWGQTAGGDGGPAVVDPTDSRYLFGQFQNGGVHRTIDTGTGYLALGICRTITDANCGSGQPSINFIPPLVGDPNNPNRLYLGAARLWRSDNAKEPNNNNVTFSPVKAATGNTLSAVAVAPGNPDIVWVGDNSGGLYRTRNGTSAAPTWEGNFAQQSAAGWQVQEIVIDRNDPARVFVTYGGFKSGNLIVTTNGLAAKPVWRDKSAGLPQAPMRGFAIHPQNNLWWYVGTEVGLFTTENGGDSWFVANDGGGTVSVEELHFLDSTSLIAVTHGRGIYRGNVAPTSGGSRFSFDRDTAVVAEGRTLTIRVVRNGTYTGAAEVSVSTGGGTATPGQDYDPLANVRVAWADGDATPKEVTLVARPDSITEGTETVTVTLSGAVNGSVAVPNTLTVSIIDPEAFPPNCEMPAGWVMDPLSESSWSVDFATKFEGACSLHSERLVNSGLSRIQFTGEFRAGNITFRRKVDARDGGGLFKFYIDGVRQGADCGCQAQVCNGVNATTATASGQTDWTQPSQLLSFPITAGTHTIMFAYERTCGDGNTTGAWIDAVSLPLASDVPPPVTGIRGDLDGDAKGDLVFQHSDGRVAAWLMNGTATTASANLIPAGAGWSVTHTADLNADGKADLLFRHADGRVYAYLMNGLAVSVGREILGAGLGWSVSHAADLNGDGRADLVLRHADGRAHIWLMDGVTVAGGGSLLPAGSGWTVVHTGDLDGDGKADLVFMHDDGRGYAYLMNGATATASVGFLAPGSGWTVSHVADLDGDGKADLLFRHADGRAHVFLMNGTSFGASAQVLPAGSGWALRLAGDLNGDGKADLVFSHTDGRVHVRLMNGISIAGAGDILGAGTGWSASHLLDLDGNGRKDIAFRHADGSITVRLMNGLVATGSRNLIGPGGWTIAPPMP